MNIPVSKYNSSYYQKYRERILKKCHERSAVKLRFIRQFKESRPCDDCGDWFPHFVMDFDHVRGKKRCAIATLVHKTSWAALWEEIKKCDLVCSNCHRIRTFKRIMLLRGIEPRFRP